jgi:DNA-binding NarL/FixJ family response regulator
LQAYRKKGEVPTSIVLVDDQATVRRGPRMRLTIDPDVEVVGEAESEEAALRLVRSVSPDVVLMDVEFPSAIARAVCWANSARSKGRSECPSLHITPET